MSYINHSVEFIATSEERLDKAISKIAIGLSRSQIQQTIKNIGVTVNASKVFDCSYKLKIDDAICFAHDTSAKPLAIGSAGIEFDIVHEDQYLLVINKPAGLTVHPGAGNYDRTLVNGLINRYGDKLSNLGGEFRPGIVHRLDKDTSGLMVVAKDNYTHQLLSSQIANREIERKYIALVYGSPSPLAGKIDRNIGRSKSNRLKMKVMKMGGRHAITHYKVLKGYGDQALSLVECKLETGRTHQIRVHFDAQKNSIVGDRLYNIASNMPLKGIDTEAINLIKSFKRQALHSYSMNFIHPIQNTKLFFTQDVPEDMRFIIDQLH